MVKSRRARVASLSFSLIDSPTRTTSHVSHYGREYRLLVQNPKSDPSTRLRAGLHSATLSLASPSPPSSASHSHRLQSMTVSSR